MEWSNQRQSLPVLEIQCWILAHFFSEGEVFKKALHLMRFLHKVMFMSIESVTKNVMREVCHLIFLFLLVRSFCGFRPALLLLLHPCCSSPFCVMTDFSWRSLSLFDSTTYLHPNEKPFHREICLCEFMDPMGKAGMWSPANNKTDVHSFLFIICPFST
jgi:hypothetical protein